MADTPQNPHQKTPLKKYLKVIVVAAIAAALAIIWGLDIFSMPGELVGAALDDTAQDASADATADATQSDEKNPASAQEGQSLLADNEFEANDMIITVPDGWHTVTEEPLAGIQPAEGGGFIQMTRAGASVVSDAATVDTAEQMQAFISTVAVANNLDVDVSQVSLKQTKDGLWRAVLPLTQELNGVACKGEIMLVAGGDVAYQVRALCPEATYDAEWPVFEQALASMSFEAPRPQ